MQYTTTFYSLIDCKTSSLLITRGLNMTGQKTKNTITAIIWILCALLIIGAFGIPKLYQNYHSAPYYNVSDRIVILEEHKSQTHKLNEYQKRQFLKIARKTIDQKDGPFDWTNYQTVYLNIYKTNKPKQYALIYIIKPKIKGSKRVITSSMIVKLNHHNLIDYYDTTTQKYSSSFSAIFNSKS